MLNIHIEGTDRILLEGLKVGISLNKNRRQLANMTEKDLLDYLKKEEYEEPENNIKISVPPMKPEYPENAGMKTKVMILPLSLEDEVQTCGTANVLKEFARDLNIQSSKKVEYVVFNKEERKFEIKAARERYIFYKEMENHEKEMVTLRKQFDTSRSFHEDEESDYQENTFIQSESSSSSFKGKMKQISSKMSKLLDTMKSLVQDKNLRDAYSAIKLHSSEWIGQVDGYERNTLQLAVESGNKKLVEALLLAGASVNTPEGCGITPLMIAINANSIDMVKILLQYVILYNCG